MSQEDYPGENAAGGCLLILGALVLIGLFSLFVYGIAVRPWLELGAATAGYGTLPGEH